ncbi:MAG TPA: hypothetical protein VJU13_02470 [Candidatus Nitrosocosmicus sp.]|nr:hypothetical protein [Candidatus Nitrosocosmicus sp.]
MRQKLEITWKSCKMNEGKQKQNINSCSMSYKNEINNNIVMRPNKKVIL